MGLRNWVVAGATEGMATEYASQGEPATTERTVLEDGLAGIL